MDYEQFIENLDQILQSTNCEIWRNVQVGYRDVSLFATRMHWSVLRVPAHLLVSYEEHPSADDFVEFLEHGFDYASRARSQGAKRVVSSHAIVLLLVCDKASGELIDWVKRRQISMRRSQWHVKGDSKTFAGTRFDFCPVIYELSTNETYYWKGFDFCGSALWPRSRRLIKDSVLALSSQIRNHGVIAGNQ